MLLVATGVDSVIVAVAQICRRRRLTDADR